jgi:hypothetical protein
VCTLQQDKTARYNTNEKLGSKMLVEGLSGRCRPPGAACKSACAGASFCSSCVKTFHKFRQEKKLLSAGFEWCYVVELACIFTDCSSPANQQNNFASATHLGRTSSMACVLRLPTLLKKVFNTWRPAPDS